jgi:hypothetical protein
LGLGAVSTFGGAGTDRVSLDVGEACQCRHHQTGRAVSTSRQRCKSRRWGLPVLSIAARRGGHRKRHTRAALMRPPGDN